MLNNDNERIYAIKRRTIMSGIPVPVRFKPGTLRPEERCTASFSIIRIMLTEAIIKHTREATVFLLTKPSLKCELAENR